MADHSYFEFSCPCGAARMAETEADRSTGETKRPSQAA